MANEVWPLGCRFLQSYEGLDRWGFPGKYAPFEEREIDKGVLGINIRGLSRYQVSPKNSDFCFKKRGTRYQ